MTRPHEQRLERLIDTVLDEMLQLTEEQRRVFVERFALAARRAGISADQAAATLRDLGRMVANRRE
jgi:DNA-directed RNA polymerase sigma subunit (sigma70/sigma32)